MTNKASVNRRRVIEYLEYLSDIGLENLPRKEVQNDPQKAITISDTSKKPVQSIPRIKEVPRVIPTASNLLTSKDPDLTSIRTDIGDCQRCKLCQTRTNIVFGSGNPQAKVMFIGEGPGADEDKQGLPFVGKAGQLLTKIIEAIQFTREQVYIANVVKCRPPGNRPPEEDEIEACRGFLFRQIEVIHPWIICALGAPSAKTLLGVKTSIGQLRGKWFQCRGTMLIPTFHPSYLLRNPAAKREVWDDVKSLRSRYDSLCNGEDSTENHPGQS